MLNIGAGRIGQSVMTAGVAGLLALAGVAGTARAGGTGENAVLLIDPNDPTSVWLGNYYKHARGIPDQNVLYMAPGAVDHAAFRAINIPALAGHIAGAGIEDHADYVLIAPSPTFFVSAPGMINDSCSAVTRFSISGAYATSFIVNDFVGGAPFSTPNRFYSTSNSAVAFDSNTTYLSGAPSTQATARRYYIGGLIGYTGVRGNTPQEIIAMIDRTTAVEGTRPTGTIYLMDNTADPDRNVRRSQFTAVRNTIINNLDGACETMVSNLPWGRRDCLGVVTGFSTSSLLAATNIELRPGIFADNLTSYAATFDTAEQDKCVNWIIKGASGTAGTVEEPCNYPGKFPNSRLHVWYLQGTTLGEAYQRSLQYAPFQNLLLGDALARPFAYIPEVTVTGMPAGIVSGTVELTPSATTTLPRGAIAGFDLLVDGVVRDSCVPGERLTLDTTLLADGWHDVRVLAYDNTPNKTTGRWAGSVTSANRGRIATIAASTSTGDLSSSFDFVVSAIGPAIREVQLVQNGRVLASRADEGVLRVPGRALGGGPSRVHGRVVYVDGKTATSAPEDVNVTPTGAAGGAAPQAHSYTKMVAADQVAVIELPATFTDENATYEVLEGPAMGEVIGGVGAFRVVRPDAGASGVDGLTFRVSTASGTSFSARVTIWWGPVCPADFNHDGFVDFFDYDGFVTCFQGECAPGETADFNDDGFVDFFDYDQFVSAFELGC